MHMHRYLKLILSSVFHNLANFFFFFFFFTVKRNLCICFHILPTLPVYFLEAEVMSVSCDSTEVIKKYLLQIAGYKMNTALLAPLRVRTHLNEFYTEDRWPQSKRTRGTRRSAYRPASAG